MAIRVNKTLDERLTALEFALNALQDLVVVDGYHRDLSQVTTGLLAQGQPTLTTLAVSATNATTLPTVLTLTNQLTSVMKDHFRDDAAHLVADTVNDPVYDGYGTTMAVDLPSAEVVLNALKTLYNAHLTQSGVHPHNDIVNSVATANATDLASSESLANALKSALNAHILNAGTNGNSPRITVRDL